MGRFIILISSFIFLPVATFADTPLSVSNEFHYQGFLKQTNGNPVTGIVSLNFQILSSDGLCMLYEETQANIDLTATKGVFNVKVGSAVNSSKRTALDPKLDMTKVFANRGTVLAANASATCPSGFTAKDFENRLLKITVEQNGVRRTIAQDQMISSVPTSMVAQSLQGLTVGDLDNRYLPSWKIGNLVADKVCRTDGNKVICDQDTATLRGPKGDRGVAGVAGVAGPAGVKGDKGDRGLTGAAGAAGVAGPAGAKGAQGDKGLKGDKGDRGEIGLQGPKGDRGLAGAAGVKGAQGDKGLKGDKGDRGEIGPAGAKGAQGDRGLTGAAGVAGATGPAGAKGDKGDRGLTGAQGPIGDRGPAGVNGLSTLRQNTCVDVQVNNCEYQPCNCPVGYYAAGIQVGISSYSQSAVHTWSKIRCCAP